MLGKLIGMLLGIVGVLAILVGLSALYGWFVQLLFNYLAPGDLWDISFKQAWAATVLCSLLFKNVSVKKS